MFGPDTSLVMDALQMAALAAVAGGGAVYLLLRRRKRPAQSSGHAAAGLSGSETIRSDLEGRVRVLERIATDTAMSDPAELAEEIESLRETSFEGAPR